MTITDDREAGAVLFFLRCRRFNWTRPRSHGVEIVRYHDERGRFDAVKQLEEVPELAGKIDSIHAGVEIRPTIIKGLRDRASLIAASMTAIDAAGRRAGRPRSGLAIT